MILVMGFLLLLAAIYAPQWWARHVLRKYRQAREDFPGTGGQFAEHLLNKLGISQVGVEITDQGDHYDPLEKKVRLSPESHAAKSLTAVATAAHEVGHALQDHLGYPPLRARLKLVRVGQQAEFLGAGLMMGIPLLTLVTRVPATGLLMFLAGLAVLGIPVIIHLVTLPVEWDASFERALPILKAGGYLNEKDLAAARVILTACALTYVAASLASLLNLWRWLAFLRR